MSLVERALKKLQQTGTPPVPARSVPPAQVAAPAPAPTPATLVETATFETVPVVVERGENRGKTITYHNVARRWHKLGEWSGQAKTFTVPIKELNTDGADTAAVVVQDGSSEKPGPMLGAAVASLR